MRPGDVATRARTLRSLGDLVSGKSLDDRVGVFVMLEALRAAGPSPAEVVAVATFQEAVGLRGARVATARVRPDIALAIDTCPANDGPGAPTSGASTRIGEHVQGGLERRDAGGVSIRVRADDAEHEDVHAVT